MPFNVRQPKTAPLEQIGELFVVDPEEVKNCRLEVVDVYAAVDDIESEIVRAAVRVSFLDASACHPDGWEDLFVVSGHLYPEADKFNMGLQYRQTPLVFLNNRDKTFREVSAQLGLTQHWKARGMAVGDFDNDGRLDILINNLDDGPVLLHNQMENTGHWLLVRCVGTKSNRSAIGTRLSVRAGDLSATREIKAGVSYLSSNDLRVHFGLVFTCINSS